MIQLQATPLARLHGAKHAGIRQRLNDVVRHNTQALGLFRPCANVRQEGCDVGKELIGVRVPARSRRRPSLDQG